MDELIRRAMEDEEDPGKTAASEPEDQPDPDETGTTDRDPADEEIFILDGDEDADADGSSDGSSEKDQLRSMIEDGAADDDGTESKGIRELASEHDEEQPIPRSGGSTTGDAEARRQERPPKDQRAEARARTEAKTEPVEEAEAVPRDQQAGMGQTAEARDMGGNEPRQKSGGTDADHSGQQATGQDQQASSSDASAERLEALSDPNDSPDTDSPSDRYRQLKEEARQEFLEQEREDNEATVEKATDSLKEKYDRLGDEYVVN